jgi:hypothetical protein
MRLYGGREGARRLSLALAVSALVVPALAVCIFKPPFQQTDASGARASRAGGANSDAAGVAQRSLEMVLNEMAVGFVQSAAISDGADRRVYPEPPLPRLPAAGGKFRDPTFGTEIMRVTDERDGKSCGTYYPHWPTLNADSTRLLVRSPDPGDAIYDFDPASFRLGRKRPMPRLPDNGVLITEGAIWSGRDPDTLYGGTFNGPTLWALDVARQTYKLVKDFSREPGFAKGDYLWQMSMSADEDTFAFTHRNAAYKVVGYAVWRRSTDKMLINSKSIIEDEVRVDKSGRYLMRYLSSQDNGFDCYVVDMQTGRQEGLKPDEPDYSPGHGDVGTGMMVAWDNNDNRFLRRSLADPHRFKSVLEMGRDWMNQHLSLLARDESWALVSFYSYKGGGGVGPGLFHDELVLVRTDGSGRFRRLLQHRSKAQDYWAMPRANLSYDGRFAAFSSNWGGSDRVDLFIARIDPPLGDSSPLRQTTQPARQPTGGSIYQRPRKVGPR